MKNLKLFVILVVSLLVGIDCMAKNQDSGYIRGRIYDFVGGNVTVIYYVGGGVKMIDTLQVSDVGEFVYNVDVEKPIRAFLSFEKYACFVALFLENGMKADLTISFHKEKNEEDDAYVPEVNYVGDNADC